MSAGYEDTTAIILAGGRATRLGGIDKGWYQLDGIPLVRHTLDRLSGQCQKTVISANRSHADYAALGYPVVADQRSDYAGPLAGIASALATVDTEFALVVPVDTPWLPRDLCCCLHGAMTPGHDLVVATSPRGRQPLHCLLRYSYASTLLPVAVFSALRFSRIPAAQALCADVGNPAKCGVIHGRRRFEAARNDAALASVPSCRSTQTPTVPFDVYLPCRSGTLRRVSSACILAVRQLSFAFVKSMITCVEWQHRLSRL